MTALLDRLVLVHFNHQFHDYGLHWITNIWGLVDWHPFIDTQNIVNQSIRFRWGKISPVRRDMIVPSFRRPLVVHTASIRVLGHVRPNLVLGLDHCLRVCRKKWGSIIWTSLFTTPRTITMVNFAPITVDLLVVFLFI